MRLIREVDLYQLVVHQFEFEGECDALGVGAEAMRVEDDLGRRERRFAEQRDDESGRRARGQRAGSHRARSAVGRRGDGRGRVVRAVAQALYSRDQSAPSRRAQLRERDGVLLAWWSGRGTLSSNRERKQMGGLGIFKDLGPLINLESQIWAGVAKESERSFGRF